MSSSLPVGADLDAFLLNIQKDDLVSKKFLMLIAGSTDLGPKKAAAKYGYSEERYFQLLRAFKSRGFEALINKKPGPKQKSVRTEPIENQIVRYKFLDDKQSAEVIAQRLRQQGHKISSTSVWRTIEKFGLQKKTL